MDVVITGASKGLGKAIAEKFAANGHHLYLTSRKEHDLYKTLEEFLTRFPGQLIKAHPFDLSIKEQALGFGQWVLDAGAHPEVLVNNAGQFLPGNTYEEKEGQLEKMMETNLYSAYHLTRTVLPYMISRKSGHIFNMCSVASLSAYPNGGSYSISKFALAGFSRNLREEMKPFGIKVTAVFPGAVYTNSWAGSGVDPQRIMQSSDIAEMVYAASLLSPQATVEEILIRPQLGDL